MQLITILVLVGHLLFLLVLFHTPQTKELEVPKRFAIKTVSLKAEKETLAKPVAPTLSSQKPKSASTKPTPIAAKGKSAPLAKAQEALQHLSTGTTSAKKGGKGEIGKLSVEGLEGNSYISGVVAHLQKHLKLPEFGEVVVELTLERSGQVVNIAIKDAKSLQNKMYVEKTLPSLKFPVFEGSLKHETAHTFIVVLHSID